MSGFPLYDSLSKTIPEVDLSTSEKKSFIKCFEKIDHEGHELVYALIRMYQMVNNEQNMSFTLPYDGKFINNDISFNLDRFPITLKQILAKFLSVHIEKMEEEMTITKQTHVKRV